MSLLDKIKRLRPIDPKTGGPEHWHSYHKLGTVLGLTGLAASGAGYVQNQKSNKIDMERKQIEAKSLAALQNIHAALSIKAPGEM